jgi:hypothetical protein
MIINGNIYHAFSIYFIVVIGFGTLWFRKDINILKKINSMFNIKHSDGYYLFFKTMGGSVFFVIGLFSLFCLWLKANFGMKAYPPPLLKTILFVQGIIPLKNSEALCLE